MSRPTALAGEAVAARPAAGRTQGPGRPAVRGRSGGRRLGPDGLLPVTPEGTWRVRPPEDVAGHTAGAGDAVVAVLASGRAAGTPWPRLLADAVGLSAATVPAPAAGALVPEAYGQFASRIRASRP